MGDLGDEPDADKMDERIWGSEDEDEDPEERKDKEEEKGSGVDKVSPLHPFADLHEKCLGGE